MAETGSLTGGENSCLKLTVEHFKVVYPLEKWKKKGLFEEKDLLDIPCHWIAFCLEASYCLLPFLAHLNCIIARKAAYTNEYSSYQFSCQ